MLKSNLSRPPYFLFCFTLCILFNLACFGNAHAFDKQSIKSDPWSAFRFGYDAYRSGDKEEAVEAYRYAAEQGHAGAQWKLARMYANGDGVARNDYEAFKIFRSIVETATEPGAADESYVSDALVALADYLETGIPNTPVHVNKQAAQRLYYEAASIYGNSKAQFEVGRLLLEDDSKSSNIKQAARWLRLAARKGHYRAQAMLGELLFQKGRVVRGLAMLTAALDRATDADRDWIQTKQEKAFGLADEGDRRTAIALADKLMKNNR